MVLNQENADSPCTYGYVYIPGDAALKEVQKEKPAFQDGAQGWWKEVIRRTAIGAGADSQGSPSVTQECTSENGDVRHDVAVNHSLGEITTRLIHRFRSREGYKLFDDSLPTRVSIASHSDLHIN